MDKQNLIELECRVWNALVSGDGAADASLLSHDFLGVYPSGFEGKDDHCNQLNAGPTIRDYQLSLFQVKKLSAEVYLLSYRAEYSRFSDERKNPSEVMYVTSIWQKSADQWLNIFSQDTVESV